MLRSKEGLGGGAQNLHGGKCGAVWRKVGECFIKNKTSRTKVIMRRRGGSYVMDVGFVEKVGGGWVSMGVAAITVDSRVEESLFPPG